ncbi:hypothetical protein L7F22_020807 [Adiantum nelumboides]|nr:hypothetical protein [Adiantum nelumboides]
MLSTTEAEYVAASESCKEAIWLTRLVGDLGIVGEIPMLHCDDQSAIQLFYAKTKHVDVKYHLIRDVYEDKHLQLVKVHTDDNTADLLTKSLFSKRFAPLRELMGIGSSTNLASHVYTVLFA